MKTVIWKTLCLVQVVCFSLCAVVVAAAFGVDSPYPYLAALSALYFAVRLPFEWGQFDLKETK